MGGRGAKGATAIPAKNPPGQRVGNGVAMVAAKRVVLGAARAVVLAVAKATAKGPFNSMWPGLPCWGVLVVGIGIGTSLSSNTQGDQGNIASSQQLDMAVADPEFCKQWGASAFVMDVEVYTTMNPSSSFVTQPTLKPGCVIRRENWSVLQKDGAISADQMRQCKQRMNTFAYIGSVKDKPQVRCVYQTDTRENKFITKGIADDSVGVTPEADQF